VSTDEEFLLAAEVHDVLDFFCVVVGPVEFD
jgi:hypothetical protein